MERYLLTKVLQDPLPSLEELKVDRTFMLQEMTGDERIEFAEVIVRAVSSDDQAVEVILFVVC